MLDHRARRCITALLIAWAAVAVPRGRAATPEQMDASISKARGWLLKHRSANGNWEQAQTPTVGPNLSPIDLKGHQWGGLTALATYALLAAGEDPASKEMQPAVEFLLHADIQSTYGLGFGAQILPYLAEKDRQVMARRDAALLLAGVYQPAASVVRQPAMWGTNAGFYSYWTGSPDVPGVGNAGPGPQPAGSSDRSNSQYGVFGMRAVADAGAEVPALYWQIVDAAWRKSQLSDGGWTYSPVSANATGTVSMTAAGVATLLTTGDLTAEENWTACKGGARDEAVEKGFDWLGHYLSQGREGDLYTMYVLERAALAGGRKYVGATDWRRAATDYLVEHQRPDGTWVAANGAVVNSAFGLLILAHARAPVLVNKLQYPGDRDAEGWRERPRDVAHFVQWMGVSRHQLLRWQSVDLDGPPADLRDAPVLYLSGRVPLVFKEAQLDALRAFVQQGGLILGNADCGREPFSRSFVALGHKLFPRYEFRPTPPTDVLFNGVTTKARLKPKIMELSNGVRKLMLLPDADLGRSWQARSAATRQDSFELGGSIVSYATGRKFAPPPPEVAGGTVPAAESTLKVARLDVGENPDPEPAGWKRLAGIIRVDHKIDLKVDTVKPEALGGFKVADLTGTGKCSLTPEARTAIKQFVNGGGTLIVDAAGGDAGFADSAEHELSDTFAPAKFELLPDDSPVYAAPRSGTKSIGWRDFARARMPDRTRPDLRAIVVGGRVAVFFSREDLTAGLVGEDVDGIYGYDPATATRLMEAMLLYARSPHDDAAKPPTLAAGPNATPRVVAAIGKREAALAQPGPAGRESLITADFNLLQALEAQKNAGDASPDLQAQIDVVKAELTNMLHPKKQ